MSVEALKPNEDDWRRAAKICREVAELPDRTSPEEYADFMLVTGDELQLILAEEFARLRDAAQRNTMIAAESELYEALKYAADNIDGCLRGDDLPSLVIRDKARAALAKAQSEDWP